MHVVESAETEGALADDVNASGRQIAVDDTSTSEARRLERLKSLPTSMPVGGIITPV
jgi:hypothetical protein